MNKFKFILSLVIVFLVFLSSIFAYKFFTPKQKVVNQAQQDSPLLRIKVAVNDEPTNPTFIVMRTMRKMGFDKQNRIEIESISAQSVKGFQALLNGVVDISTFNSVSASRQNFEMENKVRIFSAALISDQVIIETPPGLKIASLKELKGKKIGIFEKTTSQAAEFSVIATKEKVNPEKEINTIASPIPLLATMLEKGEVKAVSSTYPRAARLIATKKAEPIFSFYDFWKDKFEMKPPLVGWAAYDGWINNHKAEADAFSKSYLEASKYIIDHPEIFDDLQVRQELGIVNDQEAEIWKQRSSMFLPSQWGNEEIANETKFLEMAKDAGVIQQDYPTDVFIKL
jgi:ABC-type nitrate/sulfonate/bicarbonate transport system substrate-binding protein